MRRGVLPIVGCRILAVSFPWCQLKPIVIGPSRTTFARRVVNRMVHRIDRLGKRVLLRLTGGDTIVVEPRMTGLLLLSDPPNATHLRLELRLDSPSWPRLWYWDRRGLGSVRLMSPDELNSQLGPQRLGPDALQLSSQQLQERLATSRREIKVALLDQRAVAGIGNLYASEMLHAARIHPQTTCRRLDQQAWHDLHRAMRRILLTAIRYEGSTLADGTYRNALNRDGSYQNHHRVYMRAERLCPTCRLQPIQRIVQAQRSTFFCAVCQPKRRRR